MAFFYEYEKREFVRMSTAVPVDYKFIRGRAHSPAG